MSGVVTKPRARRNLLRHFVYLGEHADIETGERFLKAAEKACERLVQMPEMAQHDHPST